MTNNTNLSQIKVVDNTSNPAPLGLVGFGLTTILLNCHNAGFFPLNSMIMSMGIAVGGIAQVIAGILESKKNNTFGTTAFTLYGFFWISLVITWTFPALGIAEATSPFAMGFYLLLWAIFTFGMYIGTLRLNRALQTVFLSLTILFLLLSIADFTEIHIIKTIAGFEGILCGLSAIYAAIAQVINEIYCKEIMPIGVINK